MVFQERCLKWNFFLKSEIEQGRDFVAINFNLSREKAIERIKQRAIEQNRADDVDESIRKRLEAFENETMPVINHLREIDKIIEIDADQPIETVFAELVNVIEENQ